MRPRKEVGEKNGILACKMDGYIVLFSTDAVT